MSSRTNKLHDARSVSLLLNGISGVTQHTVLIADSDRETPSPTGCHRLSLQVDCDLVPVSWVLRAENLSDMIRYLQTRACS